MSTPVIDIERATKGVAPKEQIDVNGRMNVTHYGLTDLLTRKLPGELYLKLKQPEGIGSKIKPPQKSGYKILKSYMLSE
jgi:hypothetical protein